MEKLHLHYDQILQGEFNLNKLNFLFVFQVNCPGCFLYAIPFVNKLCKEFKKDVSFLGISTAFEDFEFNTETNTQLLIDSGVMVGETKKALAQHGYKIYPETIDFSIAMDKMITKESFYFMKITDKICHTHPDYGIWSDIEKKVFRDKVITYLKSLDKIALTFTLNQMRGTPTMLIFDDDYNILFSQFGHIEYQEMKTKLEDIIDCLGKDY